MQYFCDECGHHKDFHIRYNESIKCDFKNCNCICYWIELTEQQTNIFKLLALGLNVKEIAAKLNLAIKTIEAHKFTIYRKLRVRRHLEIIIIGLKSGLVKIEDMPNYGIMVKKRESEKNES